MKPDESEIRKKIRNEGNDENRRVIISSDESVHEMSDDPDDNSDPKTINSHCSTILESPSDKANTLPNLKTNLSPISSRDTSNEKDSFTVISDKTRAKLSAFKRWDKDICDKNDVNESLSLKNNQKGKGSLKDLAKKLKTSGGLSKTITNPSVGRDEDFDFVFDLWASV